MTDKPAPVSRRSLARGALAMAGAAALSGARRAEAAAPSLESLIAKPPAGFTPLVANGKITKVSAKGDFASFMQPNQLWPKPEIAKRLLEKAMMDFTGAPNLVEAMKRFIHKDDVVAIKVNGIAGQTGYTMAVNFELILPVVEAVLALGVPADKLTVYEQFPNFLAGTRVNVRQWKLPAGVKTGTHNNADHPMPDIKVFQGIATRYCRFFTEATAVIDMTQIKDHSICGYTGTLKNVTHGNINNPHKHHAGQANPQIAMLYNQPIVKSRVRLHISDAFKVTYDGGPLDKNPKTRVPHGAIYIATDPVAMDTMGWKIIDDERKARGLKSLKDVGREPKYIRSAAELGLGVHDLSAIRMQSAEV
ncbi:MAG TPA: DUF362 domain-containing protein [Polyangiaceae bacterium]|nr:DUF362 domain-containing protein [Polyangiaceae bacterium]